MKALWIILASGAVAVGALGTLSFVVFVMAGMANTKPEDANFFYRLIAAILIGGAVCLGGGVWLLIAGRTGWASVVGIFPLAFMIGTFIVASVRVS